MKNVTYYNAGAGSGKTYKLTEKLIEIFKNEDVKPENVILTTFTREAAADFKKKTREKLLDRGMLTEVSSLEDAKIGTVHSVGLYYIRKYWYILGRSSTFTELDDDAKAKYISSTLSEVAKNDDIELFNKYVRDRDLRDRGRYRDDFWKKDLADIIEYCDSFGVDDLKPCMEKSLKHIETMYPDGNVKDVKEVAKRIFSLAEKWRKDFNDFKAKNNLLSFSDMEKLFLELLDNDIVKEDIRNTIKYVFVDEFQDSNQVQLKIFDKLSDLVCRSFWVGDPKQAIYRFRGCDTELVTAIMNYLKNDEENGHKYSQELDKSWRSLEPLVNLSNSVFVPLFNDILDEKDIILHPQRKESMDAPVIYNWNLASRITEGKQKATANREMLVDATASKVRDVLNGSHHIKYVNDKDTGKLRKIRPSDIAILMLKNNHIEKQISALRKYGVPVDAVETYSDERAEIRLVKCLLSYIVNPTPSLLKAEIISLMYGKTLDELMSQDYNYDIFTNLDEIRSDYNKSSVSNLVVRIIQGLNLSKHCGRWGESESRSKVLDAVVRLAREYDESADATLDGFLSSFPEKIEINTNPDGVKVKTYHKSKGLEWPMVILDLPSRESENSALRKFCFGVTVYRDNKPTSDCLYSDFSLRYCPSMLKSSVSNVDDGVKKRVNGIFNEYYGDIVSDHRRLLYVGMTRARDYLVTLSQDGKAEFLAECGLDIKFKEKVNGKQQDKYKDQTYVCLWSDAAPQVFFEKIHDEQEVVEIEKPKEYKAIEPSSEEYVHLLKYLSPSTMEGDKSVEIEHVADISTRINVNNCPKDDYATLGTCLHNMFAVYDPEQDETITAKVFSRIAESYGMNEVLNDIQSIITSISNLYKFLVEKYGKGSAYKEYPFKYRNANGQIVGGSIDLLWRTDSGVVVIDYKNYPGYDDVTNPESEFYAGKYGPQLSAYRDVANMMSEGNVKDVLIYYSVQGRLVRAK